MHHISYTVRCTFLKNCEPTVVQDWLDWLRNGHIQDVIDGGAQSGEIFEMDLASENSDASRQFEIRYRFLDRATFEDYERNTASGLREEGLQKFPLELGMRYERSIGQSEWAID